MRYGLMGSTAAFLLAFTAFAQAADQLEAPVESSTGFFGGEWSLTIGAAALMIPEFEGSKDYRFVGQPLVSFGRKGTEQRFTSRNDNISLALIDTGNFRAGPTGKLVFGRDSDDYDDIDGLSDVDFGVEVGGFAEIYPTDWIRFRGEVRQAIGAHEGLVADGAIDAFTYLTPAVRLSGGPRITYGNDKFFDAYYGVDFSEAAVTGLSPYSPSDGVASYGAGAQLTWKATDRIETSLFGEYRRLAGPAEDSSIVQERGDRDQFSVGVSATYRFDFAL